MARGAARTSLGKCSIERGEQWAAAKAGARRGSSRGARLLEGSHRRLFGHRPLRTPRGGGAMRPKTPAEGSGGCKDTQAPTRSNPTPEKPLSAPAAAAPDVSDPAPSLLGYYSCGGLKQIQKRLRREKLAVFECSEFTESCTPPPTRPPSDSAAQPHLRSTPLLKGEAASSAPGRLQSPPGSGGGGTPGDPRVSSLRRNLETLAMPTLAPGSPTLKAYLDRKPPSPTSSPTAASDSPRRMPPSPLSRAVGTADAPRRMAPSPLSRAFLSGGR